VLTENTQCIYHCKRVNNYSRTKRNR